MKGDELSDDHSWTCPRCGRAATTVQDADSETLVIHVVGLDPNHCEMCAVMLDGFNLQTLAPGEWT